MCFREFEVRQIRDKRLRGEHTSGEAERVICVEPAVVCVTACGGPVRRDLGVLECFGHGVDG